MQLTYGFKPYLRRLGITPRRPHSFRVTSDAVLPMGNVGTYDILIGEGYDFLVDSIVIDTFYGNPAFYDCFVGFETARDHFTHYNRNGAFLNNFAVDNGEFSPYLINRSQPSAFVLPWIIKSNEVLRFNVICDWGVPLAGEIVIIVNGYLLNSHGQESPFIPFIWTLSDQADLAANAVGEIDDIPLTGPGDFICTSITSKEEWELADYVLLNVRTESADEGGRMWTDRQTWGNGSFLRCVMESTESALPLPFIILNNSIVKKIYDNDSVPMAAVRRPQLCMFGYYANPLVFPEANLREGVL